MKVVRAIRVWAVVMLRGNVFVKVLAIVLLHSVLLSASQVSSMEDFIQGKRPLRRSWWFSGRKPLTGIHEPLLGQKEGLTNVEAWPDVLRDWLRKMPGNANLASLELKSDSWGTETAEMEKMFLSWEIHDKEKWRQTNWNFDRPHSRKSEVTVSTTIKERNAPPDWALTPRNEKSALPLGLLDLGGAYRYYKTEVFPHLQHTWVRAYKDCRHSYTLHKELADVEEAEAFKRFGPRRIVFHARTQPARWTFESAIMFNGCNLGIDSIAIWVLENADHLVAAPVNTLEATR